MPEIRPLAEDDIPAVTRLLRDRIDDWPGDEAFLKATLLDHPWSDPELPSLVALDESGGIAGFVGVQARRLSFEGATVRGVVCSHLAVAPDAGAAGALLLSRLLRGDQAITWSDSANDPVVRMWLAFGGQLDHARACDWMLVLRPGRWIGSGVASVLRRRPIGRGLLPVGALPVHTVAGRIGRHDEPEAPPGVVGAAATPADIVREFPDASGRWSVSVDHDAEHLDHLFATVRRNAGSLICRLVRRDGDPIGWYAYLANDGNATRVLHLAAPEKDVDDVLGELIEHTKATGTNVLTGRVEPHLDRSLSRRLAVLGFARQPVLHCRDSKMLAALGTSTSLLTQLDAEWFVP